MALTAVRPAMNHEGNQSLHPFFSKPLRNHDPVDDTPTHETPTTDDPRDDPDYDHASTNAQPTKARKKRTRKTEAVKHKNASALAKNQASLDRFARPGQAQQADEAAGVDFAENAPEEDPNEDRRKRRKTESPQPADGLDWHQQLQVEANGASVEDMGDASMERAEEPAPALPIPTTVAPESGDVENSTLEVTPKKQIKITKSGKLVSSPPKPPAEDPVTPRKRRGRKPAKTKISPTVTIIKYGADSTSRHTIGGKIEAIMSGINSTSKRPAVPKKRLTKAAEPPKVTHPLFSGKPAQKSKEVPTKAPEQRLPTPRKSAVTPGGLRAETRRDRSPDPMPAFGMSFGANRAPKQSGLIEASWPTRETAHVRNHGLGDIVHAEPGSRPNLSLRTRKMKNRVPQLRDDEELIARLAKDLADDMRMASSQPILDFAPPEDVRLPSRLLTTGVKIQERVDEHLGDSAGLHPAVTSLFNDIEHTLTPFDEGRCEGQAWTQKYSPKCTSHVLQKGSEPTVLQDWLQNLTVLAVGGAQGPSKPESSDSKRPLRKKRKKLLDDFIVSDDDDDDDEEMIELPDVRDSPHARSLRLRRWTRNKNVVIVSGPHGCGKSAMVYAVAKELDFEVFELNSGTRRSGKDIQDKVGDMTANHLVNHKRTEMPAKEEATAPVDETDDEQSNAELQKEIDSGRQGTMMSFFKSNTTVKPKPKPKPAVKVEPQPQQTKQTPTTGAQATLTQMTASRKSQKQSLILFEEADILFEEDQQFWAQVTKLAAQSKRPIVITCNDERQIPMQDLPLAAMLRLRPSPADLAADYMLALAGREGHIVERHAVDNLYRSKNHDLRASITELDFWCQMSVGDRKGGLEWMYQRWPPGKDIDGEGCLLRVASDGTYQSGMGYLSHNVFETSSNAVFDKEEELLTEIWTDWGIHPSDMSTQPQPEHIPIDHVHTLEHLDTFLDTLSAADVYGRVGLPSYKSDYDQPLDPTLPSIADKARLSYTLAAPLLQADHHLDFLRFDTSIYTQTHLLAHRAFSVLSGVISPPGSRRLSTETQTTTVLLKIKELKNKDKPVARHDYSAAFDVLAALPDQTLPERTSFFLTPSSFDRTFSIITLDLAPYVRSIVAHEQILEAQRIRMSNLLSGGGTGKRARTTRASRVALEGGVRETKRRDRWFDKQLNFALVMATAGKKWTGMGWHGGEEEGTGSATGTQESPGASQDVAMGGTEEE